MHSSCFGKDNRTNSIKSRKLEEHSKPILRHREPRNTLYSKVWKLQVWEVSTRKWKLHVLNENWAKGPNVINDLLGVIFRFRQRKIAIAGDITKMYNTIKLSEKDQHTHRFVWRNLQMDRMPDHYALTSVTFGDRPSGAISTMALQMTAEMFQTEYPEAAELIIKKQLCG